MSKFQEADNDSELRAGFQWVIFLESRACIDSTFADASHLRPRMQVLAAVWRSPV